LSECYDNSNNNSLPKVSLYIYTDDVWRFSPDYFSPRQKKSFPEPVSGEPNKEKERLSMVMNYHSYLPPLPLSEGATDPDVRFWLERHGDLKGAGLVLFLQDNPDVFYHVSDLADLVFEGGILLQTDHGNFGRLHEEKIPMTDAQTLSQCRKELIWLVKQIEGATTLGLDDVAAALTLRFDGIRKYLGETTTPRGRIRDFPSQEMREYQRVFKLYWRVLQKAKAESWEVYCAIRQHVKTGTTFAWLTDIRLRASKKLKAERAVKGLECL
jgi:hypothetical protein